VLFLLGLELWATCLLYWNRRSWGGWLLAFISFLCLVRLGISLHREDEDRHREYQQLIQHNSFEASCLPQREREPVVEAAA
jgi:hypothetical protein